MLKPNTVLQQHGDEAEPAERREEGEGQRDAGEVRGHAGKGQRRGAHPGGRPPRTMASAMAKPISAPRIAEATLTLIEIQ